MNFKVDDVIYRLGRDSSFYRCVCIKDFSKKDGVMLWAYQSSKDDSIEWEELFLTETGYFKHPNLKDLFMTPNHVLFKINQDE